MLDEKLSLKPRHFDLARDLVTILEASFLVTTRGRHVIGVGGESGSGKSVTAECLRIELESGGHAVAVLHQDDYFRRPPRTNHEHRLRDLQHVGPDEVNLDKLDSDILAFLDGDSACSAPLIDYASNRIEGQVLDFSEANILIVEGTYVLGLPHLDVRIFLGHTYLETQVQRHERSRDATDLDPVIEDILAIESRIVSKHIAIADITVDRDYRAAIRRTDETAG